MGHLTRTNTSKLLECIDELPFINTPLHIAASYGNIQFALELMSLKPSFARKLDPNGFSPIHLALQNGTKPFGSSFRANEGFKLINTRANWMFP